MPPHSKLGGSQACQISTAIASVRLLTFLCPLASTRATSSNTRRYASLPRNLSVRVVHQDVERVFFSALAQAASCCPKFNKFANKPELNNRSMTKARGRKTFSSCRVTQRLANNDGTSLRSTHNDADTSSQSKDAGEHEGSAQALDESEIKHLVPDIDLPKDESAGRRLMNAVSADEQAQQLYRIGGGPSKKQPRTKHEYFTPNPDHPHVSLTDQLRLIKAVRELEAKLEKAQSSLHKAMERVPPVPPPERIIALPSTTSEADPGRSPVLLTKEDYLNLVDLYFYSHQSRFAPDAPDSSPTPLFLDEYSFKLSGDFTKPDDETQYVEEDEEDSSLLRHVEERLMSGQLREVSTMQAFVDLLLDDQSSNRALFEVYKKLPDPGVAYLPSGVIRLFLQRMSTPWQKSERSMFRYLSLIDDMQRASLPITSAEWSSAIYLAGRSFARVTDAEVASAFRIWREMEQDAGVQATHVTFNILFDIAVRAGKFVLGETILREMHDRGLKLNRLGRVSLIYYHGLRGDGDGVRKSYRDFVEAGEIVDTLVLNCVMASLINAQEPIAAEQIYERMKRLQERLRKGKREDGEDALFLRYPPPGSNRLGAEMASNSLGRVLLNATRLKSILPEHHAELQNKMPLTPDIITFRSLISHYATSGDLDRMTVLMNDMTEHFHLPFTTLSFQLLFRGFSIHGGTRLEEVKWTKKRLELVWQACLAAIKENQAKAPKRLKEDGFANVPSMSEVEALQEEPRSAKKDFVHSETRQSAWEAFIIDFTKPVPGEPPRLPGQRYSDGFNTPFFPPRPKDESATDAELEPDPEGRYALPSADVTVKPTPSSKTEISEVRPTKWLVIWLLRAYAQCTGSRLRLEEIWGTIRRVWKPADPRDRDAAVRALRHALRQCDIKRSS